MWNQYIGRRWKVWSAWRSSILVFGGEKNSETFTVSQLQVFKNHFRRRWLATLFQVLYYGSHLRNWFLGLGASGKTASASSETEAHPLRCVFIAELILLVLTLTAVNFSCFVKKSVSARYSWLNTTIRRTGKKCIVDKPLTGVPTHATVLGWQWQICVFEDQWIPVVEGSGHIPWTKCRVAPPRTILDLCRSPSILLFEGDNKSCPKNLNLWKSKAGIHLRKSSRNYPKKKNLCVTWASLSKLFLQADLPDTDTVASDNRDISLLNEASRDECLICLNINWSIYLICCHIFFWSVNTAKGKLHTWSNYALLGHGS